MALILLTLKNINNPIHSKSVISIIIDIFLVVFLAPVCEELIFRAYTQKLINNYSNKWIAIILTSAIFGIPHTNYLLAFIKSLCFGYIYSKFDNIKLSILLHSFGNMLVIMYEILGTYSYNIIKFIYLILGILFVIVSLSNFKKK